MFTKGEAIYVTKVAYTTHLEIQTRCRPLIVEHYTAAAVLLREGEDTQWVPRKLLKPATNNRTVFLLPRWFKVEPEWDGRFGVKNAGHSQDVLRQSEATAGNAAEI